MNQEDYTYEEKCNFGENLGEDLVNHPDHYTQGSIEYIDAARAMLGSEGFISLCQGTAAKYIWRHKHKNKPIEDLEKARVYLDWMIEEYKKSK